MWEDSSGVTHMIPQGEGGEQGDPLMPFLFSLGQHSALEVVQEDLHDSEFLFAMTRTLQPLHTESEMCTSQWMRICGFVPASASTAARRRCGMQSTTDQSFATRWRSLPAGHTPRPVWRGSDLLFEKQGIKILGTPFGHPQLVEAHLNKKIVEHEVLLERIPTVPDLQSAWSLLLHCAAARAKLLFEGGFASSHEGICAWTQWGIVEVIVRDFSCGGRLKRRKEIGSILAIECWWYGVEGRRQRCCPNFLGELGRLHAHDFQNVANLFVHELEGAREGALGAAAEARRAVTGGRIWPTEPARTRRHGALATCGNLEGGVATQGGVVHLHGAEPQSAGEAVGWSRASISLGSALLLRRLRFPLPLSLHTCRCGRQIDNFGHH